MDKAEPALFLNSFSRGSLWLELYSKISKIQGVKNVGRNIAKIPTTSFFFLQCFPKHFSLPTEKQKLSAFCLFLCQTRREWISIFSPLFSLDPGIRIGPPLTSVIDNVCFWNSRFNPWIGLHPWKQWTIFHRMIELEEAIWATNFLTCSQRQNIKLNILDKWLPDLHLNRCIEQEPLVLGI